MKKLIALLTIATVVTITASATLTKVMNNVISTGSTNTTSVAGPQVAIPTINYIADTTFPNTNILAVSIDGGTTFVNVATNYTSSTGAISWQPGIPPVTVTYRVTIITTNSSTNTVYFNY